MLPHEVQRSGVTVKEKLPGFILVANLSSPDGSRDSVFRNNYAAIQLRDELTRVPGVSDILVVGQSAQRTRIDLDVNQMAAHDLSVNETIEAIRQQNIQVAGGLGKGNVPPLLFLDPDRAKDIIVKVAPGGRILYLKDVARLEARRLERNTACFNGKPATSLFVYSLPQANRKALSTAIEDRLAQLRARLPDGLSLDVVLDFTTNLNRTPSFDHLWFDVTMPVNTARGRTLEILQRSGTILKTMDAVKDVFELSGPPFAALDEQGCILIRLASVDRTDVNRAEVIQAIRVRLAKELPGATIRLRDLWKTGRLPPGDYPVKLAIQGPNADNVRKFTAKLVDRLCKNPILTDVHVNFESVVSPQTHADIDRNGMTERGVSSAHVADTLAVCFGTPPAADFEHIDLRFSPDIGAGNNVLPRLPDMARVKIRDGAGKLFPLGDIVKLSEVQSARVINRFDLMPMEEIMANPTPGVKLAEASSLCVSLAESVRQELGLTPEYRLVWP
jgi:multidrug efflux pump subunit AcrB